MTLQASGGADTGFDTTPITATVKPALATPRETVEAGFDELGGSPASIQQATPTLDTVADMGEPKDANADLDARVAALLPDKPTTDWNAVSAFMSAVVPWPSPASDPGWINLVNGYVSRKEPGGRVNGKYPIGDGSPYKDLGRFVADVARNNNKPKVKDQFFCVSLQRDTGPKSQSGFVRGARSARAALAVKAIWIDVDVGKDGGYLTVLEALAAVIRFQETADLPPFSAIVGSGGGVHLYWISDNALTPDEWRPYAEGLKALALQHNLKCDFGVTTDIARILRIPGTFNHKTATPRPAQLFNLPLAMYDFPTDLAVLPALAPTTSNTGSQAAAKPAINIFVDGKSFANFGTPHAAFAGLKGTPGLNAGMNSNKPALDAAPIFQQCGFYRDALLTGGKDYDNTLWHYSVLGTTWLKKGDEIAHAISKNHPTYSEDGTTKEYNRCVADRANKGIGWPSCAKIAYAGCEACKTCPLLGKVKSPLNIGPDVTATVNSASEEPSPTETSFVDPYAEFVGPDFPLDILPPTLANFVNAEHRAMGADPSAIAMAALTAVAGAMHAETQVRVGDGWWERPIIWTSLLGQPSSMKSPIIEKATKPLSRIDHERDKLWRHAHRQWAQHADKKTLPCPPKPARCVINDATPEKVAEVLSRDPSGSLMVHDELAAWLGGFERYSTGQSSRAFYLSSWNGGTFLKDRVGKGNTDPDAEIRVDNLALGVLGGIQPDRLMKLGDLTSDGLLQRFLSVLMKPAKLGDPEYRVEVVEAEYEKLVKSINALPARNYHFADEASEVRDEVLGYLHRLEQVDGFSPSLIGAIGKLKGYFARICLTLHIVRTQDPLVRSDINFVSAGAFRILDPSECLSAGVNVNAAISRDVAEAAKKLLLEFLLPHMMGLYDVVVNGGQERDKLRSIANFILASDKDRLRPSDFTAGVRSLRGEPEQKIREWVGRFCSMDWLSPEEGKPGVPPKAWLVSPGLRQHFAEHRKQAQEAKAEMHAILKAGGSRRSR